MTRIFAFLTALLFSTAAFSQTYPDRGQSGLNDFAGMVDAQTAARINEKVAQIYDDHGVEITIATLSSLRFYAQDSTIEDYGLGLFNAWSVGNAEDNNGILLLVFRDDRIVRIVLGKGYEEDAAGPVTRVVDEDVTPQFRAGDYSAGIEGAVDGLLVRLIDPPTTNEPSSAPTGEGSGNTLYYVLGAVVAAIAGLVGLNRRNAAKLAATPCANCGKTGLQKSREVLREPTLEMEGAGESRITCPSCGHVDAKPYTISKLKPEGPQGGGKSDGDGATGKW